MCVSFVNVSMVGVEEKRGVGLCALICMCVCLCMCVRVCVYAVQIFCLVRTNFFLSYH